MKKVDIDIRSNVPELSYGTGQGKSVDIRSARLTEITTADDKIVITEPSSQSHSQYPFNKVDQSISGHIREVDDTPGAERLMEMHKSGTYQEILPDGTKVTKIFGDDFYIALIDHNLVVGGNLNITVQGDCNLLVKGSMKTKVDGNYNLTVNGNMTTRVEGNEVHYVKGDIDYQTNSNLTIRTQLNTKIDGIGDVDIQSSKNFITRSVDTYKIYSEGNIHIDTQEKLYLNTYYIDPGLLNIRNNDPTKGLSVAGSVFIPTSEVLLKLRVDDKMILGLNNSVTLTDPKDRGLF